MSTTAERIYAMTRIRKGDYLLPSNDLQALWCVYSYEEDGSAEWQDAEGGWHKITGTFWAAAKWHRGMPTDDDLNDEGFLNFDRWIEHACMQPSRAAAIEAVL